MSQRQRLCKAEKIIGNLVDMSWKIPRLYVHIFAADIRGDRALSIQLRMFAVQYRIGAGIVALQLFNPFSWMPLSNNIHKQ
ncbi:MAG: hypothetical protein Q8R36_05225 [bacterium]|nr:hypothetical protein [bacterium]